MQQIGRCAELMNEYLYSQQQVQKERKIYKELYRRRIQLQQKRTNHTSVNNIFSKCLPISVTIPTGWAKKRATDS